MKTDAGIKKIRISTRTIGKTYEEMAIEFLQKNGLKVLYKNYRTRAGEIDIICQQSNPNVDTKDNTKRSKINSEILVFVEVRFRRNNRFGGALMSITPSKQKKIIRGAQIFLLTKPSYRTYPCRFDIIAITLTESTPAIEWVPDAFQT